LSRGKKQWLIKRVTLSFAGGLIAMAFEVLAARLS
jgi:hypothetical protein